MIDNESSQVLIVGERIKDKLPKGTKAELAVNAQNSGFRLLFIFPNGETHFIGFGDYPSFERVFYYNGELLMAEVDSMVHSFMGEDRWMLRWLAIRRKMMHIARHLFWWRYQNAHVRWLR